MSKTGKCVDFDSSCYFFGSLTQWNYHYILFHCVLAYALFALHNSPLSKAIESHISDTYLYCGLSNTFSVDYIFILWEKYHNLFILQNLRAESCLTAKPVYILEDEKVLSTLLMI